MTLLRPFFLLLGRASVFWLGAFALATGALILAGVAGAPTRTGLHLDATFIATLWFPAAAGWLAGLFIQEFQHTSFAHHLPGVRSRIAAGYLGTGLVVTVVVAGLTAGTRSTPWSLPLTFAVGLGAYCAGGVLRDPLSGWITGLNTVLAMFVVLSSRELAGSAAEHPWVAGGIAIGIGVAGLYRLFARSTFRRKPFRPTKPLPGSFSHEKTLDYERRRRVHEGSMRTGWRSGYLGSSSWAWVRAAVHETHGGLGWRAIAKSVHGLWSLGLLVLLYAWVDKGDMPLGEAVARAIYDCLFRSPHQAQFGEKGGPYLMVVIVIAAVGCVTALFKGVALGGAIAYPLSRLQRAQVAFRAGLVDVGFLLLILGLGLFAIGSLMGLLVGYEARLDFLPLYLRALMVTLVLMPLGHRGRLQLQAATRRKDENNVVKVAFGVTAFVVAVSAGVFLLPLLSVSPVQELTTLVAALLVSQWVHRHRLTSYFRTADLA